MQLRTYTTTVTSPIPERKELRTGTLRSIIRQSGLPRFLFEEKCAARASQHFAAAGGN
jgi:hypothetical protein